jgi:hypothetical protein
MFSSFPYAPAAGLVVGPFKVKYRFNDSTLWCYETKDTYKCKKGYIHPHVSGNAFCFGNMGDTIHTMFRAGRLSEGISLLRAFFEAYDESNPYIKLKLFKPQVGNIKMKGRMVPEPRVIRHVHQMDFDWDIEECGDCDRANSAYCIQECPGGDRQCNDCLESRSFCWENCPYNTNWELRAPCHECPDDGNGSHLFYTCGESENAGNCCYLRRAVERGIRRHPLDPEEQTEIRVEDESDNEPVTDSARERFGLSPTGRMTTGEVIEDIERGGLTVNLEESWSRIRPSDGGER